MRLPGNIRRHPRFASWVGSVVALLLRLFGATWRVRTEGSDPFARGEPFIGALWHRGLLVAAHIFRDRGVAVPVSRSRDGDLTVAVLERLGFASPARGSSSRGAAAVLRQLIRVVRRGRTVGVLPDGPRGPARRVKPGLLAVARATGAPIYPVGIAARPVLRFRSWDRAILPLPFARVLVSYGEPLVVPKNTPGEDLEPLRESLECELERLSNVLDARLGMASERALEPRKA
jgi:lysophospholipid acyltransferase (LPLAT)-like uncharacterized protein